MSANCHATLYDRGGGLIYDDVLDVTWLQDVSYVQNYYGHEFRSTDWATAQKWVDDLQYTDTVRDKTWSDWRLPNVSSNYDRDNYDIYDRSEAGQNELAYMYYVNLGFEANDYAGLDPETIPNPSSDHYNPFENQYYVGIWTGTEEPIEGRDNTAWYFHFHFGRTLLDYSGEDWNTIWAVRDGDVGVAPVPVPPALLLMGSGIAFLGFMSRRRKSIQS
jgi:hypothetical protein